MAKVASVEMCCPKHVCAWLVLCEDASSYSTSFYNSLCCANFVIKYWPCDMDTYIIFGTVYLHFTFVCATGN
jgi:hypothetical protein